MPELRYIKQFNFSSIWID